MAKAKSAKKTTAPTKSRGVAKDAQSNLKPMQRKSKQTDGSTEPLMPQRGTRKEIPHEIALVKVRGLILDGVFEQGARLTEEDLDSRLNTKEVPDDEGGTSTDEKIGPVSIRRALNELAYEGLVSIQPQSGTFVSTIGEDELYQLWRTRVILEDFFVSTIARDARPLVNRSVENARQTNDKMRKLTEYVQASEKWKETVAESVRLDIEFHEQLAAAAGHSLLKNELISVRNRLRLAAGRVKVTIEQLRGIVSDHERILDAIRPKDPNTGNVRLFGDVAEAKLAINSHLRNAADRQNITSRIRHNTEYGGDPIWDLPRQLTPKDKTHDVALNALRILLELVVAAEITKQDTSDRLLVPTRVCSQMNDIAQECSGKSADDIGIQMKSRFISLDIQFHANLAFLSGLMFAGEAIVHIWQHLYEDAQSRLSGDQMRTVVDEHSKILRALTFYSGNTDEPDGMSIVLQRVMDHLVRAYSDLRKECPESSATGAQLHDSNSITKIDLPDEVVGFLKWFMLQLAAKRQAG